MDLDAFLQAAGSKLANVADTVGDAVLPPLHLRTFASTLLGNRDPITERNLTQSELVRLVSHLQGNGVPVHEQSGTMYPVTSYYKDAPDIQNTFGRFGIRVNPDGTGTATDTYDFKDKSVPANTPLKDYGVLDRAMAAFRLAQSAWNNPDRDPGDRDARIATNNASRPVRINLTKEQMKLFSRPAPSIAGEYD